MLKDLKELHRLPHILLAAFVFQSSVDLISVFCCISLRSVELFISQRPRFVLGTPPILNLLIIPLN